MAITASAPYTSGNSLTTLMRRYRDKGLSKPITGEVLMKAGVSDSLVPRTLQALQMLDLIDDSGEPTPTFEKMRTVPEADYQECLADWLRSAYADVFQYVDPSEDDSARVRDAFRTYTPHGQQDRMVALFMSLCADAGLVDESKKSAPKPGGRKQSVRTPRQKTPPVKQAREVDQRHRSHEDLAAGLPPAIAGLIQSIPKSGGWTQEMRDKFLTTFGTVLDFAIAIREEPPEEEDEGDDQ